MSNNIFEAPQNDPTEQTLDTVSVDQLVGEDKPYKTVDDLAKAKRHADNFIETLKAELHEIRNENSSLRDDAKTRERVEQMLDQLTSRNNSQEDDGDLYNQTEETPRSSQPDTQAINALIESKITQIERDRTSNQNRMKAVNKLKEEYGSGYVDRLKARSSELGLTPEELNDLAGKSPTAFLDLVIPRASPDKNDRPVDVPPSSGQPPRGPSAGQPGTPEFYRQIKKDNPRRYWSPEVQGQMHRDAIKAAEEGRSFEV